MNRIIYYALALMVLASCNHFKYVKGNVENITEDTVKVDLDDTLQTVAELNDTTEIFQTQADINEAVINNYMVDNEAVEKEFQKLLKALPQYKDEFQKEKAVWEKYMEAVKGVSRCVDTGSSTPMYSTDVLAQGRQIREVPLHYLYSHTQGKGLSYSKTTFTPDMIAQAYSVFIDAVREDDYEENKKAYEKALRQEQKCWEKLVKCREEISEALSGDLKNAFDIGTNQMMRTKLLQLKNQNRNLGMINGDIMKCELPDDCSDKELLEYPGFNKVWAKYLEDL